MQRFKPAFLAIASLLTLCSALEAARPRYGGTLRIQTQGAIRAVDPTAAPANASGASAARHVLPLVFETLTRVDPAGGLKPLLASSWEAEAGGTRWRMQLRAGLRLHDGAALELSHVADAVRAGHSRWLITTDRNTLVVDAGSEHATVPWALAELRSAIVIRRASGELIGTGPFRVERLQGNRLTLRAHDEYWGSRPFLDAVEIDMGRAPVNQLADLELGRADMVSVQPTDRRRLAQRGVRTVASRPLELFALIFEAHRATAASEAIRRTVASTIDRSSICRVLLQDYAQPADSLLPSSLSGYPSSGLFRQGRQLPRSVIAALPVDQRTLTLRVDAADPLAKSMAERIAVDAREVGFSMTVQALAGLAPRSDLRMLRVSLEATSPERALAAVMAALGTRTLASMSREPSPPPGAPLQDVYRVERGLLERDVIVPVVHLSELYGLGERVDSASGAAVLPSGEWDLANVWLAAPR